MVNLPIITGRGPEASLAERPIAFQPAQGRSGAISQAYLIQNTRPKCAGLRRRRVRFSSRDPIPFWGAKRTSRSPSKTKKIQLV